MGYELFSLLNSPRIIETLRAIRENPNTRKDLENHLKITSSRLSQLLGKLEAISLIKREGDIVSILPKGELLLEIYHVVSRFERVFEKFGEFINELSIEDIPDQLISRLYELDSVDVADAGHDFLEPHREFLSALADTRMIRGYTPVFFREYVGFFLEMAEKGVEMEIIVSEEIFRKILNEFPGEFQRGVSLNNVSFYVSKRKFRFAFVVTESLLSISFYLRTGVFDYRRDFLCRGSDAVRWGNDLFEFVKSNSELIDRQKLKELLRNR